MRSYVVLVIGETKDSFLTKWNNIKMINNFNIEDYYDISIPTNCGKKISDIWESDEMECFDFETAYLKSIIPIYIYSPMTGKPYNNKYAKQVFNLLDNTNDFLTLDNFGKKELIEYSHDIDEIDEDEIKDVILPEEVENYILNDKHLINESSILYQKYMMKFGTLFHLETNFNILIGTS